MDEHILKILEEHRAAMPKLFFPKQPNEHNVAEYLNSKERTKNTFRPIFGDRCKSDYAEMEMILYQQRKKLMDLDKNLNEKRTIGLGERQNLNEQWEDIRAKDESLKKYFMAYNQFIRDNLGKRKRAAVKIADHKAFTERYQIEIDKFVAMSKELLEGKKMMEEEIKKYNIYEDFLCKVVRTSSDFYSTRCVVNKYEDLQFVKETILNAHQSSMDGYSQATKDLNKIIKKHRLAISGLQLKVSILERRFEEAVLKTRKWQQVLSDIRCQTEVNVVETEYIKNSCEKIYMEMCKRKKTKAVDRGNYEKMFDFIKTTLLELKLVNGMVEAAEEEKLRLSEKVCVSNGTE